MKIFIDTATIDEIEKAFSYGILDGVTTNPTLIKKAVESEKTAGKNVDMRSYIARILTVAQGTRVNLEVIGTTYEEMVADGKKLYEMFNPVAENVIVKIPANPSFESGQETSFDGIRAIKTLSSSGIPINCTLVFTPEQALLAAKAGASIVSPFAARMDDYLRKQAGLTFDMMDYYPAEGEEKDGKVIEDNGVVSGIDLIAQCVEVFQSYNVNCEVLAASLRSPRQFREAALAEAHIATVPMDVIEQLLDHPKTREGMQGFTNDTVPEYASLLK